MPRLSRLVLVALLLGCATARNLVRGADRPSSSGQPPTLPRSVGSEVGRALPLGPSEQVLARTPGVSMIRRAYGATQVALVSTMGIREIHPPRVCLRAMGLEVVHRTDERSPRGCVSHLVVRDRNASASLAHFFHTYIGKGEARCDFWGRTGSAVLARLVGQSRRWSTFQVMDRDPQRARRILGQLLDRHLTRRKP